MFQWSQCLSSCNAESTLEKIIIRNLVSSQGEICARLKCKMKHKNVMFQLFVKLYSCVNSYISWRTNHFFPEFGGCCLPWASMGTCCKATEDSDRKMYIVQCWFFVNQSSTNRLDICAYLFCGTNVEKKFPPLIQCISALSKRQ